MTTPRRLLLTTLALLALAAHAQPGLVLEPPALPLRNVLIEVRQDDGSSRNDERLGADVKARAEPGRSQVEIGIDARSRSTERSSRTQQQALVLNGRPTSILLGNAVPLRLRQLVTQGGVRRMVAGTVWLQAGTGFTATPIWQGGDMVYLELTATQGRPPQLGHTASTSSTLMLPLDQWVTVADSDEALDQQQGTQGLGGVGREQRSGNARLRVQVRVSVR
jgi:hypothetical protein